MTSVRRLCDDLRLSRQGPQTSNESETTVLELYILIRHILLRSRPEFTNKSTVTTIIIIRHVSVRNTATSWRCFRLYTDVIPRWISFRQPSPLFISRVPFACVRSREHIFTIRAKRIRSNQRRSQDLFFFWREVISDNSIVHFNSFYLWKV